MNNEDIKLRLSLALIAQGECDPKVINDKVNEIFKNISET